MGPQLLSALRSALKIGGSIAITTGVLSQADVKCAADIIQHISLNPEFTLLLGSLSTLTGLTWSWQTHKKND
jgi:hypothetical protein